MQADSVMVICSGGYFANCRNMKFPGVWLALEWTQAISDYNHNKTLSTLIACEAAPHKSCMNSPHSFGRKVAVASRSSVKE